MGLLDTLQDPISWQPLGIEAGPGAAVQTLQTHRSWIFMLGDTVLKLKKALCDASVDCSTPQQRALYCAEELRLNAALAPGVYRGLVAVVPAATPAGLSLRPLGLINAAAALQAQPDAEDWMVLMRRLPADRMLDQMIVRGRLRTDHLDGMAQVLCDFWRAAAPQRNEQAFVDQFTAEWKRSKEALCSRDLAASLRLKDADTAIERLRQLLADHEPLLRQRARNGHVVSGHGDLRPEHIYLPEGPEPVRVIDALEFDPSLRTADPFDELSLLRLECARLGAGWVGDGLIERCATALPDAPPAPLLQLFAVHRAVLRARLSLLHLIEPAPRDAARWRPLASWYLHAALQA